jgi:hypothetical protein
VDAGFANLPPWSSMYTPICRMRTYLKFGSELGLPPETREKILWKNAVRLFKLPMGQPLRDAPRTSPQKTGSGDPDRHGADADDTNQFDRHRASTREIRGQHPSTP